ncbi:MAG: tRNA pseudouridine(55) synthase TruB, partial [bacterium]
MDGLLLIDKPKGSTSHDVVKEVRRLLPIKKAGHTGTLDPVATGLLLICLGRATKLTRFLQDLDKTYQGEMIFGITTTSLNGQGKAVAKKDALGLSKAKVEELFARFRGKIIQTPPMWSAVHWKGKRLYKIARNGLEVERVPRKIWIYELELLNFVSNHHPKVQFKVHCSKGTYVRSLCADIGKASGFGAYQAALCRTKVGPFDLKQAKTLKDLEEKVAQGKEKEIICSLKDALPHLPLVKVKPGVEKIVKWGRPLYLSHLDFLPKELGKGDKVRLCTQEGELLAV